MNMLKSLAIIGGLLWSACAWAQEGFYKSEQKSQGTESIELRKDGRFTYKFETAWTKATTEGSWKMSGNKLTLRSDKQLNYKVVEEIDNNSAVIYVNILAPSADQGPKMIDKLFLGEKMPFKKENSRALKYLEEYNKIASAGTPEQRDSLKRAYTPQHFVCDDYEGQADQIRILFDRKELVYKLENKTANVLTFTFDLEANPMMRYFDDEAWEIDGKKLLRTPQGVELKKGKK